MTNPTIRVRLMAPNEAVQVSILVNAVFDKHTGPLYSAGGCREFHKFTSHSALKERFDSNQATWVTAQDNIIVGVVEVRPPNHISLLFVDTLQQRKGIGKALFLQATKWITHQHPDTQYISVNASPNAEIAYARWGFKATHPEQEHNGIRYIPMLYSINAQTEGVL